MENFFYEEYFCSSIEDLICRLDLEDDEIDIKNLPEDWSVKIELTDLEPVHTFGEKDVDRLLDNIYEDRLTEDGDELGPIRNALIKYIDFEKINAEVPNLYYPNGKKEIITKQDLLEYCN